MLRVPETDSRWIAVQVKRNAYRLAETGLERQSFGVFSPKSIRMARRYGRIVEERRLLFPGYLFVAINPERPAWRSILNTQGVSRIVYGTGGQPARVPADLIDGLQSRCDSTGLLLPPREVQPGDRLVVSRGAFSNLVAVVERIDEERRVWVLLQILGGVREVEMSLDDLQLA